MKVRRKIAAVVLLFVLLTSQQFVSTTTDASQNEYGSQTYINYGLAVLNNQNVVSLAWLNSMTGGVQSVQAYEHVILASLLPLNIRMVLLNIGWQNYSVGAIPYEQWVANWLTASDNYGIENVFFLSQFTQEGIGSRWIMSLIQSDPYTRTAYPNGTLAKYVSYDNPDVASAVDTDLSIMYSYYGTHPSWVGIGTGTVPDPYNFTSSSLPTMGYSNSTLRLFSNSAFLQGSDGNNLNGTPNLIWNEFRNVTDSVSLASGMWGTSRVFNVYSNYTLAMRFLLQSNEPSISIQWYGDASGNAGNLETTIYKYNGSIPNSTSPIYIQVDNSNLFSSNQGWQTPLQYDANFTPGYYWIVFSCQSCNQTNGYDIYVRNQNIAGEEAQAYNKQYYGGSWAGVGSSILWIRGEGGSDLSIYQYENAFLGVSSQTFYASTTFSFNTVFLYLNLQSPGSSIGTLNVIDQTTGKIMASAILNQSSVRGMHGWVPFQLNRVLTAIKGNEYLIDISETGSSHLWSSSLWGLDSNPGFENQTRFLLFQLALLNVGQSNLDYTSISQTSNSISSEHLDAIGFTPSATETLTSVGILMRNQNSKIGYYDEGMLNISIESSASNGTIPSSQVLQTLSVQASRVPENGWLNVSGFNVPVRAGETYWIVLSTGNSSSFSFAVLGNPYLPLELASTDGGTTWSPLAIGGDLAFLATLTNQTLGDPINDVESTSIGTSTLLAESFVAENGTQIAGVYLGPVSQVKSLYAGDYVQVSLRPDNGNGTPSGYVLSEGKYYGNNMSGSAILVPFSSVVRLQAGQRYWIVLQPINGSYSVTTDIYSNFSSSVSAKASAMISEDRGNKWAELNGGAASFSFSLMEAALPLPEYNTSQLFKQLSDYQNFSLNSAVLRGFNAFLQSSRLWTFQNITRAFDNETGRNWTFYSSVQPDVSSSLGGFGNVVNLYGSVSPDNCASLFWYLLNRAPLSTLQFQNVWDSELLQSCNLESLIGQLNYMNYVGNSFGNKMQIQTLVVGDSAQPENLTNYLLNLYNESYLSLSAFQSYVSKNNLTRYNTVVWLSENGSNSAANSAIANYVREGGNLIIVQNQNEWQTLVQDYGLSLGRSNETTKFTLANSTDDITNHTSYYGSVKSELLPNGTSISSSLGLTMVETSYGTGNVLVIEGGPDVSSVYQTSDMTTLVSNAISYIQQGISSPIWFENPNEPKISYSITGSPGAPLLLWLTNSGTSPENVSIHLDPAYFGLGAQFSALDLSGFTTHSFYGSNAVNMNFTVAPESWTPIYLIPRASYSALLYSSGVSTLQLTAPNQDLFRVASSTNQSVILAIPFNATIKEVVLNDQISLPEFNSSQLVLNSRGGWYYQSQTHLLIVSYVSSGIDSIRVLQSIFEPTYNPVKPLLTILVALIGGEAVFVTYLKFVSRRSRAKPELNLE
ncbi:MAG: hypothetical protein JRN52_00630 [Nitrososphaerota archaeon]|nr:hypothetical protein [Nitrososphaerota archaeon]